METFYEDELSSWESEEAKREGPITKRIGIEKPFLKISDLRKGDLENEIIILEWLDFLFSKNDLESLIDILFYYVDLEWISEEVRNRMVSYARGFREKEKETLVSGIQVDDKKYRLGEEESEEGKGESIGKGVIKESQFSPTDHLKSLIYILEIVKDKIPEEAYKRIRDRALEREKSE